MQYYLKHILSFTALLGIMIGVSVLTASAAPDSPRVLHIPDHNRVPVHQQGTTPEVIASDASENFTGPWTIGGGFVYWSNHCVFLGDSFTHAVLRRKPINGGLRSTLVFVADPTGADCIPVADPFGMVSDDHNLYYYNDTNIYFRAVTSPGIETIIYTMPHSISAGLVLDKEHIYWGSSNNEIIRAAKDGSGTTIIAITEEMPTSLTVDDTHVYWFDDNGLWQAETSCALPPCTRQRLVNTTGHAPLSYRNHVYWVDTTAGVDLRIRQINLSNGVITTLYTAPEPSSFSYLISNLATHDNFIFWKEEILSTVSNPRSRVRRMSLSGGVPDDIAVNLQPEGQQLLNSSGYIFTDDIGVYFKRTLRPSLITEIVRLPFNAQAIVRDLASDDLEVTQGIQSTANDVPLVAAKTTYVRFYGREVTGIQANAVEATLRGFRDGIELPGSPLRPVNSVQTLIVDTVVDRSNVNDGWLFRLPRSWTLSGDLTLTATVDPRRVYNDSNRGNNQLSGTFRFLPKSPICTIFVPVRTHAPPASTRLPNFWNTIYLTNQLLPAPNIWTFSQSTDIAEFQICFGDPIPVPYPCYGAYELPEDKSKILNSLWVRDQFSDDPDQCDDTDARTHYVGMVHPDTPTGSLNGSANRTGIDPDQLLFKLPPLGPFKWNETPRASTFAHELGHNYGRRHVDCGGPDTTDEDYPYPPCQLDNLSQSAHYGFDIKALEPIAPDQARDTMAYGIERWSSDYTWKGILDELENGGPPFGPASSSSLNVSGSINSSTQLFATEDNNSTIVMVSGTINTSLTQGQLDYAWSYPVAVLGPDIAQKWQALIAPDSSGTSYHLRILAVDGTILDDRAVTLVGNTEDADQEDFAFILTFLTPDSAVAQLDLMKDDLVLASLEPGANVPTLTIVQPAGGESFSDEMTMVWNASDADGDDLLYTVQYSPDEGQTWQAVATNFPGPFQSEVVTLTLESLNGIPGSNPASLIRVAASDGYHTTIATSNPFFVNNHEPEPFILSPASGQVVEAGQTIQLRGNAIDTEDGQIPDDALQWIINGQDYGSGPEQQAEGLAPGTYNVMLTARDSTGQEQTTQETFTIAPLKIQLGSEPIHDGFCDDSTYANGMTLQLEPYTDGGQATALLVRTNTNLWVCFSGLNQSIDESGSFAGIRLDSNNSRDALAQPNDYGFFVSEDGTPSTTAGDGTGGFDEAGPGGLLARVSANDTIWNAELRIDLDVLGNGSQRVGIDLGHYSVRFQGDDYHWPYLSVFNLPNTWAETLLGDGTQPTGIVIDGPEIGAVGEDIAFTARIMPDTVEIPVTYTWQATDQLLITHTGNVNDEVVFNWDTPGEKEITLTVTSVGNTIIAIHTVVIESVEGPSDDINEIFLPIILKEFVSKPPPPASCVPNLIETINVGSTPRGLTIDSNHNRIYVANYGSDSISVIDSNNHTVIQTITPITAANQIAYDPTHNIIWVTNYDNNQVTPIQANAEATTFTVLTPITVGEGPWGVTYDAVHDYIYVVNNLGDSVTVIDAETRTVVDTLSDSFNEPFNVTIHPASGKVYVTNFGDSSVAVLEGTAVTSIVNLFDSGQPFGITVDETRDLVYIATVNSHRIVTINTNTDQMLGWAEFHRGFGDPNRPVPLRSIDINPDIGPAGDGGHVWATTSTVDGSEANQILLIPKGWSGGFNQPAPYDLELTSAADIAVDRTNNRVYIASDTSPGTITVLNDNTNVCLVPFGTDDGIGMEVFTKPE